MNFSGKVLRVGDHIDTDAIIPARYLVTADPQILGKYCMEDFEPGWSARVKKGDILVGGKNFGCGSSREHAPIAILGTGIGVVIAESFARIFYRNAFNMGLLPLELGQAVSGINEGDELSVDGEKGVIINNTKGKTYTCPALPGVMKTIIERGGLIAYVAEIIQVK
jgi:3-isopropylmalate/(R)-2-methylmalate dehydratase small subunit